MITGHFDLALKGAGNLGDQEFEQAMREGKLPALLDTLPTEGKYGADNLIFDLLPPWCGIATFQTPSVGDLWRNNPPGSASPFCNICLLTTDSEPDYQSEWYRAGGYDIVVPSAVSESANASSGGKLFEEEASEVADMRSDPGGREAVWYRERWLYLPSQGVSSNIRSIGIYWSYDSTTSSAGRTRSARVRLKDSGGNPIIINKGSNQVLLVEYKVTFVSI